MEIRYRRLSACFDAVAGEKRFLARTEAPPLERITACIESNVDNGHTQYVAEQEGRIGGWRDAVPNTRAAGLKHRATLGMGVLREFRGQGIGERLLRTVIRHACSRGAMRIDLDVRADNTAAIGLYEKVGFRREGRKPMGVCVDGQCFDLILMGLVDDRRGT